MSGVRVPIVLKLHDRSEIPDWQGVLLLLAYISVTFVCEFQWYVHTTFVFFMGLQLVKWVLLNRKMCGVESAEILKMMLKIFPPLHLSINKTLFSSLNSRKLWSIECISYRVFKLLEAPNDSRLCICTVVTCTSPRSCVLYAVIKVFLVMFRFYWWIDRKIGQLRTSSHPWYILLMVLKKRVVRRSSGSRRVVNDW